jgi:hypothetical protein
MLAARAISILPKGERPKVMSPLGVVPKGTEEKFRLVINMRYVNKYLVKKMFKFEGLNHLSDLAEKGDHAVSFDLTSGYYHMELHPRTRTHNGFEWKGSYYFYNCLPFGLATAPWAFSKVMRERVIYWRKGASTSSLTWMISSFQKRESMPAISSIEGSRRTSSTRGSSSTSPSANWTRRFASGNWASTSTWVTGKFRVPVDRWEVLHSKMGAFLAARGGRVQARKLSSLKGTVISMKLAWGPVTQLYTMHMYALINSVFSLNCWVTLTEKAKGDLFSGKRCHASALTRTFGPR